MKAPFPDVPVAACSLGRTFFSQFISMSQVYTLPTVFATVIRIFINVNRQGSQDFFFLMISLSLSMFLRSSSALASLASSFRENTIPS